MPHSPLPPHMRDSRGWQWGGLAGVDISKGGFEPSCARSTSGREGDVGKRG